MDEIREPLANTQTAVCARCRSAWEVELPVCVRAVIVPACEDCTPPATIADEEAA